MELQQFEGITIRQFKITFSFIPVILLGLLIASCQAPHDNPFDPMSPAYHPASPPDRIADFSLDSLLNLNCRLVWTAPEGATDYLLYSGLSGWRGADTSGAERYPGELPGVKPAGVRQYAWIELPPGETRAWVLYSLSNSGLMSAGSNSVVIAAPARDRSAQIDVWAKSIHRDSWGSLPYYELQVDAAINDSDGVDRVWVKFGSVEIGSLQPVDSLTWIGHFPEANLNGYQLGEFIGHPFTLHHLDSARFVSVSEPFYLPRIIYDFPVIVSPENDTLLTTDQPLLEWRSFSADFNFTYRVEIWHVPAGSAGSTLVYSISGLPADLTSHQVTEHLPTEPQYLYWILTVIDEFGDEASSLTASFRIAEGG